jgi:hypothetical protein
MDRFNQRDWGRIAGSNHIVDWQLSGTVRAAAYEAGERDLRERIRVLEARALTLVRAATSNPHAVVAHRSLVAIDAEIAALRAQLAWRSAEGRAA